MKALCKIIATVGGLGYFPVAPGTIGTVAGVGYFYLLRFFFPEPNVLLVFNILSIGVLGWIGGWAAGQAALILKKGSDPREVVIDEFLSILITMFLIPYSHLAMAIGFVLNRLLDIGKPYPARRIQDLPGGWGIMLDDVVSGIYSNLILRVILIFVSPNIA